MDFENSNQKTIQVYEDNIEKFIEKTVSVTSEMPKEWIDLSLGMIKAGARVLELGSATGRDGIYIKNLGYDIRCTDATEGFLDVLAKRGLNPDRLNAITDELGGPYEMILANCVFLHFNKKELDVTLKKCFESLAADGVLTCSFMLGAGEIWRNHKVKHRYFHLWQPEDIISILRRHGFKTVYMRTGDKPAYADKFYIIAAKT